MQVIYNPADRAYRCQDTKGTWYPQGQTMFEAIQHALSVVFYWKGINK